MRGMGNAERSEQAAQLALGALFADRYQIEAVLGRGGMGVVYRARDLSLGEEIALKVLAFGHDPSPLAVLRFREEVKLARRVTHPNVARVYDIGEHQGVLYLTMELIDGGTLRALLQRECPLNPGRAVEIARSICAGLEAAHKAGIVHRDIKPTNILIDQRGRFVLSDFGIARSLAEAPSLTMGMVGTPYYMAPEQAYGGPVDARADVYALGRILYEMMTGEGAEALPETLAETLLQKGVPPVLAALVLSCIEREPSARPHSVTEILRALAEIRIEAADEERTRIRPLREPVLLSDETIVTDMAREIARFPSDPSIAGERSLAVLPFLYRGPKDSDYLGEVITDELVDILSRTRSLRVFGTGATSKFRIERDPRAIGRELGAFAVIDGTVQLAGPRVRISIRLADAASGAQLWSERHEGTLEDLFEFQDAIARRVAEELRVEITTITHRGDAPAIAIEHYLNARRRLYDFDYPSAVDAIAGFERCIELAPGFTPALAGHAIASLRAWNFDAGSPDAPDWEQQATASVARAIEHAPELAETHLAAGMRAAQYGDYRAAVRALNQALAIAPTCANANEYLGMLECEAGQSQSGTKRLKLATELDPELPYPFSLLARHYALRGRYEAADHLVDRIEQGGGANMVVAAMSRMRTAAWRGDRATLLRITNDGRGARSFRWKLITLYTESMLGEFDEREIAQRFAQLIASVRNRRRITLSFQLVTEVFAGLGKLELAMEHLAQAANLYLFDLEWLNLCPLLGPLRALPEFAEARRLVLARVELILTT
jgi:eukaryotic-like serine/threonine-protein kinase